MNNNKTIEQIVDEITEEKPVEISSTNHIYQNVPKEQPREKIWTSPFLLESPKIINIPTWNGIKILHPKFLPLKTTRRLATAQGSALTNYKKIQLFLVPTETINKTNS